MNKKIIGLLIVSSFSGSVLATQEQNNVDILNSVLEQLQGNKNSEKNSEVPLTKEPTVVNNDNTKELNEKQLPNNIIEQQTQNFGNQQYVKKEEESNKVILSEPMQPSHNVGQQINNLAVQDVIDSKTNIELKNEELFLVNVPIQSKLTATIDIQIPPYRDMLFYEDGKIVSEYPFNLNPKSTFCYLVLEKSGMWRRFKSDVNKVLQITSNVTEKQKFQQKNDNNNFIEVYKTTISFDNKHIKNLVCETSEKSLPLTIKDLNLATGNLFNFEFTPIQDI